MKAIPLPRLLGLLAGFSAPLSAAPDAPPAAKPPAPPVAEITIDDYSDIIGSLKSRDAAAKAEAIAADEAAAAARASRIRRAIAIPGGVMQQTELGAAHFVSARGSEILTIDTEGRLRLPDTVHAPQHLTNIPTSKLQLKPDYPIELRRQGIGGVVTVNFIVDRDGNVAAAWALRSTHAGFERSAVNAVTRWKFTPGRIRGAAVDAVMTVDIAFNPHDGR